MWAGLNFSWHWQPEIRQKNMTPIVANGSQGMWLTIVASGSERIKIRQYWDYHLWAGIPS